MCYCRDCQGFLDKLGRPDLLDDHGGTQIVPAYPAEIRILRGAEHLVCNRLSPEGLFRWSSGCCNSPIGNTRAKFPWFGLIHSAFRAADPQSLERLGAIRSRIFGRDARGTPPFPIPDRIGFRDMMVVLPFVAKGLIGRKHKGSPFFEADGRTPIRPPRLL